MISNGSASIIAVSQRNSVSGIRICCNSHEINAIDVIGLPIALIPKIDCHQIIGIVFNICIAGNRIHIERGSGNNVRLSRLENS